MNDWLSIKDICGILGVSRDTVARLCRPDKQTGKPELENVRIGKIIRVQRSALEVFIERNIRRAW